MKPYHIRYKLVEDKHYHDCQDVISHPLVVEAFKFGDTQGSGYDAIEWDGSYYAAELLEYDTFTAEVFVGEWLGDVNDQEAI